MAVDFTFRRDTQRLAPSRAIVVGEEQVHCGLTRRRDPALSAQVQQGSLIAPASDDGGALPRPAIIIAAEVPGAVAFCLAADSWIDESAAIAGHMQCSI